MATVLHYAQTFIQGALTVENDIPIPLQIGFYAILAVFITIVVIMFYPTLQMSRARDSFMWYYYIAIFNLVNICLFLWFYHRKKTDGSLVGDTGDPGTFGPKGGSGSNADCSLCATNLYIQPVKYSAAIAHLDLDILTSASLGPQLPQTVNNLAASTNHTLFDYNGIVEQLLIVGSSTESSSQLTDISEIAENSEYVLLSYINNTQGIGLVTSDKSNAGVGAISINRASLASGTVGYLSLGDSIGNLTANGGQQMFVINGDIRSTDTAGYETRAIITIINSKQLDTTSPDSSQPHSTAVSQYRVLKPRILKTNTHSNNNGDKNSGDSGDIYDTVGEILVGENEEVPKLHYSLISSSCLEPLTPDELQFATIYPMQDGSGYLSFWRTSFGTMHTRRADILNINTNSNSKQLEESSIERERPRLLSLLIENGEHKYKTDARRITQQLAKIRVPQYVTVSIVLGHIIEYTKYLIGEILTQHWQIISSLSQPQQLPYLKQHRDRPQDINTTEISRLISIIGNITTATPKMPKSSKSPNASNNTNKIQPKSLYNMGSNGGVLEAQTAKAKIAHDMYSLSQDYERMRVGVADAGIQIENINTLLDLILIVSGLGANGDLTRRIYISDLSPTATRVLAICSALVSPPTTRVYKPKDTCLVSSRLDSTRLLVIRKLQKAMRNYDIALSQITTNNNNISKESQQYINNLTESAFEELAANLGSIKDYMNKLQRGQFDEFSQQRLNTTLHIFKTLTNSIST